ncbi:hypothetical protein ACFL12_05830 [Pseudomonadota bacterium]
MQEHDPSHIDPAQLEERRKRGRANLTWILLVLTFLTVLAGPTMIVLFFGMVPTLVAYITDSSKGKSAAITVGSINFIGVFPYVMDLWANINTFDAAFTTVSDFFALLVMYMAAAFGWFLFLGLPTIVSSFVIVMQQRKVAQLRGEQKELIEEWGPDVAALVEMQRMEDHDDAMESALSEPPMPPN